MTDFGRIGQSLFSKSISAASSWPAKSASIGQSGRPSPWHRSINRHFPDNTQIQGNHTTGPTAEGTASFPQPSDRLILETGPRLEDHSVIFLAIQTHLSCRFLLAVDSLGLPRSGSWSQIINQAQDFAEQFLRHGNFGQLGRDIPAMADHLGTDLHQPLS